MAYTVLVDDNFEYTDEEKRYKLGEFETMEAAIEACKRIVDDFLVSAYTPGMSARALYANYTSFGEDPWISGVENVPFSAWNYAEQRCVEISGDIEKPGS